MNNQKVNILPYILGLAIFLGIGYGLLSFNSADKKMDNTKNLYTIEIPKKYNTALVIEAMKKEFAIKPVNAQNVEVKELSENKFKYVDAYKNTDVIQTKTSNKLKEDIILKTLDHPNIFEYKIDIANYDFEKDAQGNFHFYPRGEKDELNKVFTIPAPFMIDADDENSGTKNVYTTLKNDGTLIIEPNQDWLKQAKYPVILDPTIEITILTLHSHPLSGEDWVVDFRTVGKEDLKIIPIDQATIDDDIFTGLFCGEEERTPQILDGDVIYYPDWECEEIAKVVHYTEIADKHTLRFEFGDQITYAYNTVETLRPNGDSSIELSRNTGITNYEQVDETVSDDDTTYVYQEGKTNYNDLYTVENSGVGSGTINSVTVKINAYKEGGSGAAYANTKLFTHSTAYDGVENVIETSYTVYSTQYTTNPNTDSAWTWSEINDMEVGVEMWGNNIGTRFRCTQVWVEIDYTEAVSNNEPTISDVTDSPSIVKVDSDVTFSVDWNDADSEGIKMFICDSDGISTETPGCTGNTYCSDSDDWDMTDPITCDYTTQENEVGLNNYYAFVCDDEVSCSLASSGFFIVGNKTKINIGPNGIRIKPSTEGGKIIIKN